MPALVAAAGLVLAACGPSSSSAPTGSLAGDEFDSQRAFADLRDQVELGPRPAGSPASRKLTLRLAAELRRAGVRKVRIQRPQRNVVGVIEGRGNGYVVVGAHHDTKAGLGPRFVGANDGASGVAVVLELARAIAARPGLERPALAIALFDGEEARPGRSFEEDGTRGSRQYVRLAKAGGGQGTPSLKRIRAMVLFDMVGDCDLAIPRESSSDAALYELFAEAAEGPPFGGEVGAIGDDHVPFLQAGIPAVDLIDFEYGPGGRPGAWWHTPEDNLERVCPESLDRVGEAALVALPQIP